MSRFCIFISVLFILIFNSVPAQDSGANKNAPGGPPPSRIVLVKVDLTNRVILDRVPFDMATRFTGSVPAYVDSLGFTFYGPAYQISTEGEGKNKKPETRKNGIQVDEKFGESWWSANGDTTKKIFTVPILIDRFKPNRDYIIEVSEYDNKSRKIKGYRIYFRTETGLSDHIKLDFGIGHAFKPVATIGVVTAHFYLVAINNDTDLIDDRISIGRHILLRSSVFGGISPLTFNSDTRQELKKLTGIGNVVYGIGIRSPFYGPWLDTGNFGRIAFQPMRLNLGVLRFSQEDANPLIATNRSKSALYASITYDFNLATLFGPIFKAFL